MSNVIRLVNGGSIQVRTGVIQGIGPQGPRGVAGPQGIDGDQGPVGATGPVGQILQLSSKSNVSTTNTIAANTDTTLAYGSVTYDDLSCFTSTTNITLVAAGDYMLSTWVRFDDAAAGYRDLWFVTGGAIIARNSRGSVVGNPFYAELTHMFRSSGSQIVNVLARSGQATAVSLGGVTVTRVGSGPPGAIGPTGPQGPIGATGATGPTGPTGSASSGFATYAALL